MEERQSSLLMKESCLDVQEPNYLRRYFCGFWVDHRYVKIGDSRFELLAPLGKAIESPIPEPRFVLGRAVVTPFVAHLRLKGNHAEVYPLTEGRVSSRSSRHGD